MGKVRYAFYNTCVLEKEDQYQNNRVKRIEANRQRERLALVNKKPGKKKGELNWRKCSERRAKSPFFDWGDRLTDHEAE